MSACIFLDIDGTLLNHEVDIQESSKVATTQAQANRHRICLTTGCPKPEVEDEILFIPFDDCIYFCDTMMESNGNALFYEPFPQGPIRHMILLIRTHAIGFNLEGSRASFLDPTGYDFFHSLFQRSMKDNSKLTRQYMAAIRMHPLQELKETDILRIIKITISITRESRLDEFDRQLPARLEHIHHGFHEGCTNGEIYNHTITEATGMDCLLSHFQISLEASIAAGDGLDDAEMVRHCSIEVVMGDACEELELISDMITTTSKEDGIYNCLRKLKLIQQAEHKVYFSFWKHC